MYEFIETKRSGVGPGPEGDMPPAGKQHFSNLVRDFFPMAAEGPRDREDGEDIFQW